MMRAPRSAVGGGGSSLADMSLREVAARVGEVIREISAELPAAKSLPHAVDIALRPDRRAFVGVLFIALAAALAIIAF